MELYDFLCFFGRWVKMNIEHVQQPNAAFLLLFAMVLMKYSSQG
jgi:hypothetical protein